MEFLTRVKTMMQSLGTPYPTRDWYIALSITGLIAIVLASIAAYLFIGIQAGFIFVPERSNGVGGPTVSREALMRTLETYETRTLNFEAENYTVPSVSDPSQ